MPLKLNVGASRKVTDNNYGSRGTSVNLELELDASLVADPPQLRERIRGMPPVSESRRRSRYLHGMPGFFRQGVWEGSICAPVFPRS